MSLGLCKVLQWIHGILQDRMARENGQLGNKRLLFHIKDMGSILKECNLGKAITHHT